MGNDQGEIRALFQAWRAAVEGADVPTLLDLVTEDALFLAPGAPPLQGKAAVEAVYHRTFAAYRVTQDFEEQELLLFGDWALVRGVERGSVHPLDGAEPVAVPPRRDQWARVDDERHQSRAGLLAARAAARSRFSSSGEASR